MLGRAPRAAAVILGAAACLAACSKAPVVTSRPVTLHAPAACAPGASAYGVFTPLGDFAPSATPPELYLSSTGQVLSIPGGTEEMEVDVTATELGWRAHALVPSSGGVDALLLPFQQPCALTDPVAQERGAAFTAIDRAHALLAGGATGRSVPASVIVDLSRGTVAPLAAGLLVPRTDASATAWPGGAVVAGGVRPDTGQTAASAEVYSTALGDFDGQLVTLSLARAQQGAATLIDGRTLLVGGIDSSGAVLSSMEIVDPASHRAQTTKLASLAVARSSPTVLVLASGEVLVAGGVDETGTPIGTLEWFAPDGSKASRAAQVLVASSHQAFVRLPAGGALAVVAPDSPAASFDTVWVISADGGLEPATAVPGALSDPHLYDGDDQSPILWTGDRWLFWDAWAGAFEPLALAIGAPGPTGYTGASPEPGLAVWVTGTTVTAMRFGTRGPYASTAQPFLVSGTANTAPDRLVTAPSGPIAFDATTGLTLQQGASVFVTDATFADFALDALTPGGAPPAFVLRDASGNETVLDATSCPVAAGATIHFERAGGGVTASAGGASVACSAAPAAGVRVSLGVRGQSASAPSVVRSLSITRR
jgi:hypothetical protein